MHAEKHAQQFCADTHPSDAWGFAPSTAQHLCNNDQRLLRSHGNNATGSETVSVFAQPTVLLTFTCQRWAQAQKTSAKQIGMEADNKWLAFHRPVSAIGGWSVAANKGLFVT